MTWRWSRARGVVAVLGLVATLFAASCGNNSSATKTTATFAELPGTIPNYIFPVSSGKYFNIANLSQFQSLLYRPLYWFGDKGQVAFNPTLSLAQQPRYAADGKSVTITLKSGIAWSDGQAVTTRDIEFWQNLVTANKTMWAAYSPGEYPDNVTSTTVNSPTSITFDLSQAYGSYYFTYNELSQITPLPQHVWDKESATGTIGDYDRTSAGAQAVYKFLDSQSSNITTYPTNPLWQVVDGPWKLKSLDTTGTLKLVPNTTYFGTKAKLTEFDEVEFTKATDELALIKTGPDTSNSIDYGYLPEADLSQKDAITSLGYTFQPWTGWQITYFPENFTNPTSGPIFTQLYFRQAMQMLIDQNTDISKAFGGQGYPTYGPVPVKPSNSFTDPLETSNPYPFSISKAVTLLQSHGWTVTPGGTSTCSSPGTGANQCGDGVPAGAQASFKLEYASGTPALDQEMTQLKSDFARAGIQISLSTSPFNTVIGDATPCSPGQPCKWDMEFWGGGWIYTPDYYPTGDQLFATGAGSNYGGFTDAMMDQLIMTTESSSSLSALTQYEDYCAKTLPVLFMPTAYSQLSLINTHLHGVVQDPLLNIYPENWSWS